MEKLEIGPYNPDTNISEDESMLYKDNHGFFLSRLNETDSGRGDCIGLNFGMYFIYDDPSLVEANSQQWYRDFETGKFIGDRHPELPNSVHPMSRDHYLNTLMSLKLFLIRNENDAFQSVQCSRYRTKIKNMQKHTGFFISKKARKTLELACYGKAIQNKIFFEFLYYLLEIIAAVIGYLPFTKLALWLGDYGEEVDQDEWETLYLQRQPRYKRWLHKIVFPSYALIKVGYKLYLLDGIPWMNRLVKWFYRPLIGETNYVQQMLLGKKGIPRDKVESFKAMRGGRWSSYLNTRNDRFLTVFNPALHNFTSNLEDVDLVRKLYNETQL